MSGKHLFLSLEQTETINTPNNEQQIQQVQPMFYWSLDV
jgi:hypothetical protein